MAIHFTIDEIKSQRIITPESPCKVNPLPPIKTWDHFYHFINLNNSDSELFLFKKNYTEDDINIFRIFMFIIYNNNNEDFVIIHINNDYRVFDDNDEIIINKSNTLEIAYNNYFKGFVNQENVSGELYRYPYNLTEIYRLDNPVIDYEDAVFCTTITDFSSFDNYLKSICYIPKTTKSAAKR